MAQKSQIDSREPEEWKFWGPTAWTQAERQLVLASAFAVRNLTAAKGLWPPRGDYTALEWVPLLQR
jgi:hypothetical protein